MEKIDRIYIPYYNSDDTEGRGPMVPEDFAFANKRDGEKYIDKQPGVMGIREAWSRKERGDWQLREFRLYHSMSEFSQGERQALKDQALSKLSPEERRALGH
jgi:hypothetical protein